MSPVIQSIHVGGPKSLRDHRGEWISSIARDRVDGPIQVLSGGLEGDRVAQPYHGGSDAAICVHLSDHYRFWNERYGIHLNEGGLGENLVLDGITEDEVHAGDLVQIGTALVQVSGPRVPCANQARHVGVKDWVKLTIRENRTGFYLRVLQTGTIHAGNRWQLRERLNQLGAIPAINRCFYLDFSPATASEFARLNGLAEWWKQQFLEKMKYRDEHWSQTIGE
jgi:MOSC domain-containing protein YiiM